MCEHCMTAWEGYTSESAKVMNVNNIAVAKAKTYEEIIRAMDERHNAMKSVDEFYIRVKENCKQKKVTK